MLTLSSASGSSRASTHLQASSMDRVFTRHFSKSGLIEKCLFNRRRFPPPTLPFLSGQRFGGYWEELTQYYEQIYHGLGERATYSKSLDINYCSFTCLKGFRNVATGF